MRLTRTVITAMIASTLLVAPAEAGWKSRLLKGAAIGVGGYVIGKMSSGAAEAAEVEVEPAVDPRNDTSMFAIAKAGFTTALELYRTGFSSDMCRATEHLTIEYNLDTVDFNNKHYECCSMGSNRFLSEISAVSSYFGQFKDFKAGNSGSVADAALLAFTNGVMNSSTYMDMYKLGLGSKLKIAQSCVAVAEVYNSAN